MKTRRNNIYSSSHLSDSYAETNHEQQHLKTWLEWIVINGLTSAFAYSIGWGYPQMHIWAMGGALIGLGQVMILRYFFHRVYWWFFTTTLAFIISEIALDKVAVYAALAVVFSDINNLSSFLISATLFGIIVGCLAGIPGGIGQWLLLKDMIPKSYLLIYSNVLGITLGSSIGFIIVHLVYKTIIELFPTIEIALPMLVSMFGSAIGIMNGMVTGKLLLYLLSRYFQNQNV
jgi:hypothetical protein